MFWCRESCLNLQGPASKVFATLKVDSSLVLKVDGNASSNASLEGGAAGADGHVHVNVGGRAVKDWLLDAELDKRLVDVVGLGGAVASGLAAGGAAVRVATAHGETFGMARARGGRLTLGAVDEGDVVPDLATGDGVFELGLLAVLDAVRLGDLQRGTARVEGLVVLRVSRDLGAGSLVVSTDGRDPDVVVAAVGEDGVTGQGKACLEGHEDSGLGEHFFCS